VGCEREFRRAFALNPNYAFAHDQFGMALAFQGRFDEAIAEGFAGDRTGSAVCSDPR
jgi:Tfp pilus assembly protein PilF